MSKQIRQQAIGIMGGTYDPVHIGHLRAAIEFAEAFSLAQVRLMPCHLPPHRNSPSVASGHRKEMLDLAVRGVDLLSIDDGELKSDETSYTFLSLSRLRKELGDDTPIYFALGSDAFNAIETWKEWKGLFGLANFVVLQRPSTELRVTSGFLTDRVSVFENRHSAYGNIHVLPVSALDISSTRIRSLIASGKSIKFLVPDQVEQYINQYQLYR